MRYSISLNRIPGDVLNKLVHCTNLVVPVGDWEGTC